VKKEENGPTFIADLDHFFCILCCIVSMKQTRRPFFRSKIEQKQEETSFFFLQKGAHGQATHFCAEGAQKPSAAFSPSWKESFQNGENAAGGATGPAPARATSQANSR
jgi:hypothetical protein